MKQLIIGIYDDGYDFTINMLNIGDNTTSKRILKRYDFEDVNKKINKKLRNLAEKIYYSMEDDIIYYLKNHNYLNEFDSILIVDNGYITIVK